MGVIFAFGALFALIWAANLIAQRLHPTLVGDRFVRHISYRYLVQFVIAGLAVFVGGILYLAGVIR